MSSRAARPLAWDRSRTARRWKCPSAGLACCRTFYRAESDMAMTIAVPREIRAGERRVAATPETVGQLLKLGFSVNVETQAGLAASFDDDSYRAAGAQIVSDTNALWSGADIVIKVRAPE